MLFDIPEFEFGRSDLEFRDFPMQQQSSLSQQLSLLTDSRDLSL